VPACFIAGKSDWGVYQNPGALGRMQTVACTQWRGTNFVDGAGHWVQQEQPEEVGRLLLQFIRGSEEGSLRLASLPHRSAVPTR
jgi:pimeloyl-ACP methyl ester carboxylesterase